MSLKLRLDDLIEEKSKREKRVINQKVVAEEADITPSTLSRYVNGFVSSFSHNTVEKLLDYFDLDVSEMGRLFSRVHQVNIRELEDK